MVTPADDFLGMSDDDFLQINEPVAAPVADTSQGEPGEQVETPAAPVLEEEKPVVEEPVEDPSDEEVMATTNEEVEPAEEKADDAEKSEEPAVEEPVDDAAIAAAAAAEAKDDKPVADPAGKQAEGEKPEVKKEGEPGDAKEGADKDKDADASKKVEETPVNYEGFYKQVMAPFKANGKTIEVKTPDEAIRLMQMGAGYGRKLQDLQPHLKVIRMLEKSDLLDSERISFLIDINEKNPNAIKQLIKESGIDPLDINMEDNVSYQPTNHSVSDQEMAFHTALTEVSSLPKGQETVQVINQTWDQESKSALWEDPKILGVIQEQRELGIYDQISAEVDRQKMMGEIPHNTPFLQAYKTAGDHLVKSGGLKVQGEQPNPEPPQIPTPPAEQVQPQVIESRAAQPKPKVTNGGKASAASVTKTAPGKVTGKRVNPLNMPDEEFLKTFNDRL